MVARVVRQLLWGEEIVNQGRGAEAAQPKDRLGWVTARAAQGFASATLLLTPRMTPLHICERDQAIVGVVVASIIFVIGFRPISQPLASVKVPPNCLHSFQLLCLVVDNLYIWPMIKFSKLQINVSLCGREPQPWQDRAILCDEIDLLCQILPLFFGGDWRRPSARYLLTMLHAIMVIKVSSEDLDL